jgi:phosphohistidine phosphatase
LVHHGDAVGPDVDPARPLSTRGRVEVDLLAQKAADRGVRPALIWHSGKLRAKQTAEAFWRRCNPLSTFAAVRGLQPTDPEAWMADTILSEQRHLRDVMVVGHFPHIPKLLTYLLSGSTDTVSAGFPVNGMVALENVDGRWEERWRLG